MSPKAQAILEEIKSLPPAELQDVCVGIRRLEARRQEWEEQQEKLREMQSRHAGRGLLDRLLEERAKERARGASGEGLLLEGADTEMLRPLGITPDALQAKIESLRITFEQWHTELNSERQGAALREVFGGPI
jgi:hypothetical protein